MRYLRPLICYIFGVIAFFQLDAQREFEDGYFMAKDGDSINCLDTEMAQMNNLIVIYKQQFRVSSLDIQKRKFSSRDNMFGNSISFGLGVGLEYLLPLNRNKWSLSFEPSYQYYKLTSIKEVSNIAGRMLVSKVNYKSIELPLTFRYYLFLDKKYKLFINASYYSDIAISSSIDFFRSDGIPADRSLDFKSRNNMAFGLGCKRNDKFSLELRGQAGGEVISDVNTWDSDYKSMALIFGYSLN